MSVMQAMAWPELLMLLYGAGVLNVMEEVVAFDRNADLREGRDLLGIIGRNLAYGLSQCSARDVHYVTVLREDEGLIAGFLDEMEPAGGYLKLDWVNQRENTVIMPVRSSFERGKNVVLLGLKPEEGHPEIARALRELGLICDYSIFLVSAIPGHESNEEKTLSGMGIHVYSFMKDIWIKNYLQENRIG